MITLLATFAAFDNGPFGTSLQLRNGIVVSAVWKPGTYIENRGWIVLTIKSGKTCRTEEVQFPKDTWPQEDIAQRPAVMITKDSNPNRAILDLTLYQESGVYNVREVFSYKIDPSAQTILKRFGTPFYFFGYGSWRRISPRVVEFWDFYWANNEPHGGRHRYNLVRFTQRSKWNIDVKRYRTVSEYAKEWETFDQDSNEVNRSDDPLREFGTRWTWWGDREAQKSLPARLTESRRLK